MKRPVSTSLAGAPGKILSKQNLKRETFIFQKYLEGLSNPDLEYAFESFKMSDHRRMNNILREENPDFSALPEIDLDHEYKNHKQKKAKDPNYDPKGLAFHRLRLLYNASVLERDVFPIGYTLKAGMVLYRAIALMKDQLPKKGQTIVDHAFMSTSVAGASQNFSGDAVGWRNFDSYLEVSLKITNRGFKGKVLPGVASENEIILPRNTPLKIISIRKNGRAVLIEADLLPSW